MLSNYYRLSKLTEAKEKKPTLEEVLKKVYKDFDKKLKVLIDTSPIKEKDLKKKK